MLARIRDGQACYVFSAAVNLNLEVGDTAVWNSLNLYLGVFNRGIDHLFEDHLDVDDGSAVGDY